MSDTDDGTLAALANNPYPHTAEVVMDLDNVFGNTENVVRAALEVTRDSLRLKRLDRDALNAEIRELVAQEEYLTQAVRVFDRAKKGVPDAPAS